MIPRASISSLSADHRGPVAGVDLQIPSRTRHHLAGGGRILAMDHRHRRQVVVDLAQRPVLRRLGSPDDEFDTGRVELVRVTGQNRLDDRRRREVGDVQDRAGAADGSHRVAQHVVRQTRHHANIRAELPCQQCDFEIHRVIGPRADDGARAMHPGAQQIGGGVDPDDPRAGAPQFLDDRLRQRVVTADDDFAMKLKGLSFVAQQPVDFSAGQRGRSRQA